MKKFWMTRLIVVVYCASIVIGCRPTKQQSNVDKNDDTDTVTPGNNKAEQASTTVVNEISDNISITDTPSILQESEVKKNKRSERGDNPLSSSNEEEMKEIKPRKTRQKSYKCYCEEASYRSDCLKKCQNARQFDKDDYAQDISIEMTEDPVEGYSNKVPRTTTESAKFSIPYAKNVNFDQRVILGDKYPQSYSFYSNPRIKIPKNHLFPIYPQTPQLQYAIAYPKLVRNGIPSIKQNYVTSALKKPMPKGIYTPSIIGRNFANIQECIKLYGQTVCVIAPTTQSTVPNSETTVDFMTGNTMEKNINEIDDSCADNNHNQNLKSTAYPNRLIYQTNTISPLYEMKYPSDHDPKLKSSVIINKLYSVGPDSLKLQNYLGNEQQPYADHFNYGNQIFLNNGQIQNLPKSFNGKYYLNNMNIGQATSPNNNGKEKHLYYYQTVDNSTPRPITQKPVYATKYPFPTTPSYAYLDEYDKSRNDLQDTNILQQTIYPPYTQQTADHSNNQNYYFEGGRETTGYPVQYPTTVPISRHDYGQDSKLVTNQPIHHYNEYKNNQAHSSLNEIQSITGDRYVDSQERGFSNDRNLPEQATISPFLQRTSTYVTGQQKSDYQSRYEENVSSRLQKYYQKINENNYNLAEANNNLAQGMSPSNKEKDRKIFLSNEYDYNSDKKSSSEINSHTSTQVYNNIPENQSVGHTTKSVIDIENTLQANSKDDDSSRIITSIRKEYDNLNPMSFSHDPQRNHQAIYENVNYYKSDSAQSKNNELYYSSNEALKHEKYKNNERPQPQFDYSNFPQSMSRIVNEANGQYINGQYPQYRPENILKEYPNSHVYDSNDKNMHYNGEPYSTQYNMCTATPATPIHKDNFAKTVIPKTDSPDPTSYVDRNIPDYTTISMTHTTPSILAYNNKVGTTNNEEKGSNYEYQDRYNTRLSLQSSNLKKQDMVGHPEQFDKAQIANVKSNSKFESNTFSSKITSESFKDITKSLTTLDNIENDEYKKHNPVRTSTARSIDDPNINDPSIQSRRKYPGRQSKQKVRLKMFNDSDTLFKGLEQIILNNYDPVLSEENTDQSIQSSVPKEFSQGTDTKKIAEKILFGNFNEQIKENIQSYGQAGISEIESNKPYVKGAPGTENPIQSVDDIPATIRENINSELTTQATVDNNETPQQNINEFLVQNTIRKVINNFVPEKAEDLMANYANKNAKEVVGAKVSDLLPEIVDTAVIRNLLSIPEIENMIVDIAGGLLGRMTHIAGDIVSYIRRSFRHVVNNEIPRPTPTMAPFAVEEHRFKGGEWVIEPVSLLGSSKTDELKSLPREVFDKIQSILNRSRMSEEEAGQPIVQNLIVKAVKHSLNKEQGIVQESAIRKAFKIIVKPTSGKSLSTSSPSYHKTPPAEAKQANIPKAEDTASYGLYKLAPTVPIKESNYQNGYWRESQKLLVDTNRKKISTDFDEKAKQAMQKQLDKVKTIKVTSEEKEDRYTEVSDIDFETSSENEYKEEDDVNENENENENEYGNEKEDEDDYSVIEDNAKDVLLNNANDESLDQQPIKYYSPTDRVLEYLKMHQNGINPSFSTTAEIIGRANEYDTTTPMSGTKGGHLSLGYEPEVTENLVIQKTDPKPSNRNQLNLLFDSPKDFMIPRSQTVTNDGKNLGQSNQFIGDPLTEYLPKSASNLQTYMGRLVPVDEKASQAKDLSDLQNSNLVYVGDGVRLPLTIRKLPDGTFALTLSDELCKQFLQKQCPCCLPGDSNGFVVREQKSIKDIPKWNISNNESQGTTKIRNSKKKSHYKHRRQYKDKESSEVTTPTEDLVAHISPHSDNQKESEEQIKVAPLKVEQNSNTNIYTRIRRESGEQKEAVQRENFADRENFMENHIETSLENKDKVLFVDDASNEKFSQKDRDTEEFQLNNNERESFEAYFDYQQEEPFDLHVIPGMIGPYRYQQLYAKENADAVRNMLLALHDA